MDDMIEMIKAVEAKIDSLQKGDPRIAELETKLAALQDDFRRAAQKPAAAEKADASAGAEFVKSEAYKAFSEGRAGRARVFLKNTISAPAVPFARVAPALPRKELMVEDVLPAFSTAANLVEYVRETAFTNNAAATTEGAAKPESAITYENVQAPVQVVAHWLKITKQLAADAPALAQYINARMLQGLADKVEAEILVGSGTAPHLKGLFATGNYTVHGLTQGTNETNLDLIRKSAMKVRVAGFRPNIVIMNPADFDANVMGLKTTDGIYLVSNPTSDDVPTVWGLRVVLSSNVTAGKFLVGDSSMANIWNRAGAVIELFEQDEDNVQKNLITVRAERRLALSVEAPAAFVGGDLWS